MGRLFDSKETSTSTTIKGRLFTEPVAEQQSTLSKVGEFVKPIAQDLYSTAATIPVRATQAEELLRTQAFGSNDSKKKAMEFASQPVNIGLGTQVKPLDTSSVGRAAQQTAGDIIKTASLTNIGGRLTFAKQAALQGGAYGLGNAMSEGKSTVDTAKDTAIGTGLGLVGGKILSALGGLKRTRELSKKTEEELFKEASARANLGPIPEASNPRYSLPAPRTPEQTPIPMEAPGVLEQQAKLRETPVQSQPVVERTGIAKVAEGYNVRQDFVNSQIKNETITKAVSIPKTEQALRSTKKSLNDFIKSETNFLINTQQKIPKGYKEKLTKIWEASNKEPIVIVPNAKRTKELEAIWNEAHTVPTVKSTKLPIESTSKTPSLPFGSKPTPENTNKIIGYETNSYGKKIPIYEETISPVTTPTKTTTKASKVKTTTPVTNIEPVVTPKPVSYTKDPVQSLTKVMETELPPDVDPIFVSTTLKQQTAQYDSIATNTSVDDLIDMSMSLKPIPEGLNPVSIHALTSIRKDLTVEQAMRLKNIYPLSQAGQDLSLARLKSGAIIDNPIDMMQAVEKTMKEQVIKKGINKTDIKNLFPDCGFN